jgi:mono/diheme cytochrome c family protein
MRKKTRMKKILIIAASFMAVGLLGSCRFSKRSEGYNYMPDMAYSRAYETYAELDSSKFTNIAAEAGGKIYYDRMPVAGTVARGEMPAFPLPIDKMGDSTNYVASKAILNPLPPLSSVDSVEAARLYLVNCGICHGEILDGNGPLYKGGDGPYKAAPRPLINDPITANMPDGQMFYSITYGRNAMGSYASQLSTEQRWMLVHYIKAKQNEARKPTATAPADSAAVKK